MVMKKLKTFIILIVFVILSMFVLSGCGENPDNNLTNNDGISSGTDITKPCIISVDGIKPTGMSIKLSVGIGCDKLEMLNSIQVSEGAIYKIYDEKNNFVASKVVELQDGDNYFYIEVSLPDGTQAVTYKLIIFKSYNITVNYSYKNINGIAYVLKEVTVEQGTLFKADYVPTILGYDFIGWCYDDREFKEERLVSDATLTANITPKKGVLHFILDGEEWDTLDTIYYERYDLPIPTKENYHFNKWCHDEYCTVEVGIWNNYDCRYWGDQYVYGKMEPNLYTVTYDYGEVRNDYTISKSYQYGEDFEVDKPYYSCYEYNGKKYIFSGFTYNGEPFVSGKYLYDGDITVTAVWTLAEE